MQVLLTDRSPHETEQWAGERLSTREMKLRGKERFALIAHEQH